MIRRFLIMLVIIIVAAVAGFFVGAKVALGEETWLDSATCAEYLSTPRVERINRNRQVFYERLRNPGFIREQQACAQDPARLLRMEQSIERMCKPYMERKVRNAWKSALSQHMVACNWR
jgi:hypothetical protein